MAEHTVNTFSDEKTTIIECPTGEGWTRNGHSFTGWNTMADGSGTTYLPSQDVYFSENVTLYAQWDPPKCVVGFDP